MELTFLGTGAGMPSARRNVSSIVLDLQAECGSSWMFDCGEGTQHQLLKSNVKPGRIDRLLVTHLHGDHLFGIPGFLSSRSHLGGDTPLTLYGPAGVETFVRTALGVSDSHLGYELRIVELSQEGVVFENDRFVVEALRLAHRIESFGYRIVERDTPGALQAERLRAEFGPLSGPLMGKLKRGEAIVLADGTEVNGALYVDPPRKGRVVAVLGDTSPCPNAALLANGADLLVHEATFLAELRDNALRFGHSTSVDAARTALSAGAKQLLLTHISSRYAEEGEAAMLAEARTLFAETHLAKDLTTWPILRENDPRMDNRDI
ncbi:MAG: ribonuclease Z [Paenibacillaceae bacterium]|nr:ribonuclease Z [Paenibacillaceae bacterium]